MTDTRVLVLEANPVFRRGLQALLDLEEGLRVVAAPATLDQLEDLVDRERPHVAVIGVDDRATGASTLLRRMLDVDPGLPVVVLGHGAKAGAAQQFLRNGARAYLHKDTSADYLASVVREVTRDDDKVFISASPAGIPSLFARQDDVLSKREQEVLVLVAEAMSNAQIARTLCITKGTVKRHLHNIFAKLDAVSRLDAVNKARLRMTTRPC